MQTPRSALVVEGGGMRGSYAAGALIELLGPDPQRYDAVWATSSGAASAAYGLAGQREGLEIWRRHLHGRRLVAPMRLATGGNALDLDYLIDEVFRRRVPLDVDRLRSSRAPLHVPVTDVATGRARYFDLRREDPFRVLRAAMSLPGATREAVTIRGRQYIDGGVWDQVPVAAAIRSGATDITAVLTRPLGHEPRPTPPLALWWATRTFPGIRRALLVRHTRHLRSLRLLARPPRGVRARVVAPPPGLRIRRWTTRQGRLLAAIEQGIEDARRVLGAPSAPSGGAR